MVRRLLAIPAATAAAVAAALFLNRPAPGRPPEASRPAAAPAQSPQAAAAPPRSNPVEAAEPPVPPRSTTRHAVAPKPESTGPAPAAPAPERDGATLRIDSDVPGAQVFLDREYLGTTPVTARNIKPGSHRLNASAAGYDGVAETIDVEPGGRELTVRFKEVRLDVAIDVVHKHRFGSCRGRLVATPAGLRYETSDKGDGFSAPLADLTELDVDYLKKNLHLELRNGRRYDFTDPAGDADRLFVFHRDVSKARDRLIVADSGRP